MKSLLIIGHVPLSRSHPDCGAIGRHPGRWVYDQARAVSKYTDFKVTLVTLVAGASRDYIDSVDNLKIIYLKSERRGRLRSFFIRDIWRMRKLIKKERPDLIHAHGTEDAYALSSIFSFIPCKVLTIQGLYADVNQNQSVRLWNPTFLLAKLESFSLKRHKEVIVKSKHVQSFVKKYFAHVETEIIPNTISESFLETSHSLKIPNRIAYVGSVLARKGVHHIVEALENVPQKCELHVYGEALDEEYLDLIFNILEGTKHEVIMHGCVDSEQLVSELAKTNILIAPSYAETFGNQVIEGLLCECFCIVTEDTGMAENVKKYGYGVTVPKRDHKEIAQHINSKLTFTEECLNQRKVARKAVIDDLGPKQIALKLQTLYFKTLQAPK